MNPQVLTSTTLAESAVGQPPAGRLQPGGELLGVDLVAGAAEGDQADGTLIRRHTESLR